MFTFLSFSSPADISHSPMQESRTGGSLVGLANGAVETLPPACKVAAEPEVHQDQHNRGCVVLGRAVSQQLSHTCVKEPRINLQTGVIGNGCFKDFFYRILTRMHPRFLSSCHHSRVRGAFPQPPISVQCLGGSRSCRSRHSSSPSW